MAEQIKFDKSLGFEGMYTEVYTFLPHTAPMIWALAKLQWDSTLDIDELLAEFYEKMYGPAASAMADYFSLLEQEWNTPRPGRDGWVHRNIKRQALSVSPEGVDRGLDMLRQAIGLADNPDIRARIDIHRAALRYAGYAIKAYDLSQRIAATSVTGRQSADRVMRMVARVSRMAAEREPFWAECHDREDLLGQSIRGLGDHMGYLVNGHVGELEAGAFIGAMRALSWYQDHASDEFVAAVRRLQTPEGATLADTIRAWLWVQETRPQSLAINGDFDDTESNTQKAERDWETGDAPPGWSRWSRTPSATFDLAENRGRADSVAAAIMGAASACYLQSHQATPGDKYLALAWIRNGSPGLESDARLGIRFQQADGSWHNRPDLEPTVTAIPGNDWQLLVVTFYIPDGASSLLLMPGAANQRQSGEVLFDDVALYKLPSDYR
jgi:hypothetical protein